MIKNNAKLVNQLLQLRNQIKLYHWQTDMHSRHVSADKFLDKAEKIIDNIVESYQGKYGIIYLNGNNKNIKLDNIKDKDIKKYLLTVRDFLIKIYPQFINKNTNTDLLNLRDELIAEINITLYLFNQKN